MLKFNQERVFNNTQDKYCISHLYYSIDGSEYKYFCDILEDVDRGLYQAQSIDQIKAIKVKGQTAIPTGKYKFVWTENSKFAVKYGHKIGTLLAVPGFDLIRVHRGNYPKDTEGCELLGYNKSKGMVVNSTEAETKFYNTFKNYNEAEWVITRKY